MEALNSRRQSGIQRFTWQLFAWGFISLCIAIFYLRSPGSPHVIVPQDFNAYLTAKKRIVHHENPYVREDILPYKYAPGILLPLQHLPDNEKHAWKIFGMINLAALWVALVLGSRCSSWKDFGLLVLGFVLAWKGILETLDYGQIEFILFSFVVLGANCWKRAPCASGFLLGTLPWLKLPWFFFIAPFGVRAAIQKDGRRFTQFLVGYTTVSLLWLVILPCSFWGIAKTVELTKNWFILLAAQPPGLFYSDMNQGLWRFWFHFFVDPLGANPLGVNQSAPQSTLLLAGLLPAVVICTFSGCLLAWLLWKRDQKNLAYADPLSWISPWFIFGQLMSPLAWRWASLLLVGLPFAFKRRTLMRDHFNKYSIIAIATILWLLQQNPITQIVGLHWTQLHPFHVITFYWLALLLLAI